MLRCCRLPLSLAMVMMISRAILQRKTNGRHFAIVTHAFRPSLTVLVPFFRKRGRVVDQRLQWRTSDSDRGHAEFTVSPASRMHRVAAFSKALSSSAAYSDENEVTTNTKTIKTTSAPAIITTRVDGNSPILQGLNPSQVDAVTQPVASITRVVAGPGSGKTRVLTSRIAWLLQQKASNHRILGVTFTRKASGEMQQRLNKLLVEQQQLIMSKSSDIAEETVGDVKATPAGLERVTLGTFHSICAKILRWNGDHLVSLPSVVDDMSKSSSRPVLDGTFNIADQGEQIRIIKESLTEANIDLKSYDLKPLQVLSAVSRCKSILAMGENPFPDENGKKQTIRPVMHIAKKIYFRYREMLLSSNCIDFDDLIYLTRELLLINEEIRDRLQKRWNHVLVDEFQDTSQTQMDLIKLLTSSSLFVVGDADQSIYSWRGAHAGSLSDFEHEFKKYNVDGVSTVYLMENYRLAYGQGFISV